VGWQSRRALQRALAATQEELAAVSTAVEEDRRRMVMTVSHELRTPMTIIQGIVNTLEMHWATLTEGQRLDLIDTIATNVASLDATILHFIDVAELERGEKTLHLGDVDLAGVIDAVVNKLGPVVAGHTVRRQLYVENAWADRDAVGRILELLIANAARFSPLATTIYVRARPGDDGGVDLAVVDQGPGIPPTHLPHIFEPFWRADTGEYGVSRGAGLGLTIVKELAELHGGSVRVQSSRRRGSAFHVLLPGDTDSHAKAPALPAGRRVG
jgi:signal transduction histidine kinase